MPTWHEESLADICQIGPPKKEARKALADADFVSFVPMENLGVCTKALTLTETRRLGDVVGSYTYFADGDVLLAKITPCFENGKIGIASGLRNGVGFGSSEFVVLRPGEGVDPEYLFYFLSRDSFRAAGRSVMSGAVGHKRIPKEFIEKLRLPLPPLPEQKRIVSILDEAFAGIDKAVANAEKNLANARELFDATLHAAFARRGSDWERRDLATLLERGWILSHLDGNHGSDYPRKDEFVESGVPYISANCLRDEQLDMSLAKYLSPERAALLRKGIAHDGDLLFAHNATVGPVAILRTSEPKVVLSTSLTYYRCNPAHIIVEYLAHYMRSREFVTQYEQVMRQSTRNQVPITKQREFFHIVPPLGEQRRIAAELDALTESLRSVYAIYRSKLEKYGELRQSLLHKAFTGELTAQPEKALAEAAV